MKHRLLLLYKMVNNHSPEYLSSLVPSTVNNISRYNLHNAQTIQTLDLLNISILFCHLLLENGIICHLMWETVILLLFLNVNWTLTLNPSLDISMQVIDVLRYFTPDYVQSVAHLTMTSFRNVSMIHLSVCVVMWKILITTFCVVDYSWNLPAHSSYTTNCLPT